MRRPRPITTVVLGAGMCGLLLSACSGGTPKASTSTTSAPPDTAPPIKATEPPCTPTDVSAAVDYTKFGGSSSTLAGGIVFTDTGTSPCTLRGVPHVQVVALDGSSIPTYQENGPVAPTTTVLTPASQASGGGATAVASVTFSSWTCTVGSFSLTARFSGWTTSVPVPAGASTGAPCTTTQEPDQTIYIGPVTASL